MLGLAFKTILTNALTAALVSAFLTCNSTNHDAPIFYVYRFAAHYNERGKL